MTPAFHFNISANENWTLNKDHDDGYSYISTDSNNTRLRYYNSSKETMSVEYKAKNIG